MEKSRQKLSGGFKVIFGITLFNFLAFLGLFVVFGLLASQTKDADIKGGFADVINFHLSDIKGLFTFNFHNGSNVVYFSLSGLLYFLIFIAVLYLIVGIIMMFRRKRATAVAGIIASIFVIFAYIIVATGLPKYWAIINQRGSFENNNSLIVPTFGLLIFSALFGLTSYILYFYGLFIVVKSPVINKENAEEQPEIESETAAEENDEEPVLFEEVKLDEQPQESIQKETNNDDFIESLKEVIRDIVRDELARNNSKQNNEPQIVQNFYGYASQTKPIEQVPVEEKPVEQPVVEEPVAEPAPQPEVIVEPEMVPEVKEEPAPVADKKPIIRIPFTDRMLDASFEMQKNYNELKNEIMSYGVNSRVSNSGDTFRLHRQTFVKITIAGLSLKLYFALDPKDYSDSTLPIQDAGHKGIYEETPLVFKVRSGLSMRRCKQLIQDVFDKNGMEQGEIGNTDWVKELANSAKDED